MVGRDAEEKAAPVEDDPVRGWFTTLFSNFAQAAGDGFGTRARSVGPTMSVGDVVVPLCSDLDRRQSLANSGIYVGVEYEICDLAVRGGEERGGGGGVESVRSLSGRSESDLASAVALVRPRYPLRVNLERSDWPVPVQPLRDVPLWLSRTTYEVGTALGTLALCATYLGIAVVASSLIRFVYVPTESMVPAVLPGDVVLVSRTAPTWPLHPKSGDVVFFDPPEELDRAIAESSVGKAGGAVPTRGKQFLKRVVGGPGDRVGVHDSQPFVLDGNGRVVVDAAGPYARPDVFPDRSWEREASVLGRGEYFVAGDNGPRSVDSRVWGPLRERYIFGAARMVVYPPEHFGPIRRGNFVEQTMELKE